MTNTIILLLLDIVLLLLLALGYSYAYFSEREEQLRKKIHAGKAETEAERNYALMLWLSEIGAARTMAAGERSRCRGVSRDDFDREFYRKLLGYDDVNTLRKIVDQRLSGYGSCLRRDFPELSDKEEVLVYLYLLRLDDATICLLGEYSPNSLPKIKNRLSKKLQLESATSLRVYLQLRLQEE